MVNQKKCMDCYGERLKIGDEVIPILDEALIIGIGGVISKIEYSERFDNHYITITDNEGKVLLQKVDSRCYTTQARYDERENQEYVYSLTFYSDILYPITSLPLTNRTDADYEIPENTCLVLLKAQHLTKKGECSKSFYSETIYNYFFEGNIKLYCDKKNKDYDFYYVMNDNGNWYPIYNGYKIVQSEKELKKYVKNIIEYFKSYDLSDVNNDVLYDENLEARTFEKQFVLHL